MFPPTAVPMEAITTMKTTYSHLVHTVLEENRKVLTAIKPEQVDVLLDEICKAKQIQLYGMGRMKLSVRGFAMSLEHMGFKSNIVYETVTPSIGPGDLLIDHCGATLSELNVVRLAKDAGARVAVLTAHPESEIGKLADVVVQVPGQIFGGPSEVSSVQPMSTLLEQSLFLFTDMVTMLLMQKTGVTIDEMKRRHANLEGLFKPFA